MAYSDQNSVLGNATGANDPTAILREQTKRDRDFRRQMDLTTNGAGSIFTFFLMLLMGKDNELLQNDNALNDLAQAFHLDANDFKSTIKQFQNGDLSVFQTALNLRNKVSDISAVDWSKEEQAVSKYAESGNPLLEIIADKESNGNYNRVYGAGNKTVDLTNMSINEVMAWQKNYTDNGSPSSAAGKYQVIRSTLAQSAKELGLSGEEKFDEAMQDRIAMHLLEKEGLSDYKAGRISEEKFMENVSTSWAAVPKDMSGKSYYHGDGLNQALISPATMLVAIRQIKEPEPKTTLAGKFDTALAAKEPLQTDGAQPDPIKSPFNNGGVDQVEAAAVIAMNLEDASVEKSTIAPRMGGRG